MTAVAIAVAFAAAIRSTWSPCGLSMVSSINPLTERARGRRYGVTASCFVVGAVLGGTALGALGAVPAAIVGTRGWSDTVAWTVAGLAAAVTVSSDLPRFAWQLPDHPRQVDQAWLSRYRSWVYGGGFGLQIGFGFATYIMTGAVYLMLVLGALTGSALTALAVGVTFGLARGLAVFLGSRCRSHAQLAAVHRFLDRSTEPVRVAVIAVQVVVAVGAAATALMAGSVVALGLLLVWFAVLALAAVRPVPRLSSPSS